MTLTITAPELAHRLAAMDPLRFARPVPNALLRPAPDAPLRPALVASWRHTPRCSQHALRASRGADTVLKQGLAIPRCDAATSRTGPAPMKIQIFSDLHIGFARLKPIMIAADVDVVVVAGDTCEGVLRAFEHLRRIVPIHVPIVMVMGNHEYYRRFIPEELALAQSIAPSFNIHLLEDDCVVIGTHSVGGTSVRFTGATLWTDYRAFGADNQAAVMNACANAMNDHRLIGWQKQPWLRFRPQEAALLHHRSRRYLEHALAVPFAGPTVMCVHHAVHWQSVAERFLGDPVSAAFVSDLEDWLMVAQPNLIIHGHVHNSSDYFVGRSRVICNPHGYGDENPAFDGALVVDVGP